jgi:hypothetical protein
VIQWWVNLWDRREPATAQALVRIGVGVCLLFDLLQVRWLGLVDAVWAPPPDGMGYGSSPRLWSQHWFGADAGTSELLWWVCTIAVALFTVGALTRVACVVFVLVYAQMAMISPDADRGIDMICRAVVGVLALSWCHARWSVDAWVRARFLGRPFPELVPAWPRLLLFAQLVWIYFSGGHNKTGPEWGPAGGFAALANVLSDPHFARFSADWVPTLYPLMVVATAATMAFELGSPGIIVLTALDRRPGRVGWVAARLRWVWIVTGVLLHLNIAVFMRLGLFPWAMIAMYPVLLHPDELVRVEAWIVGRVRKLRG